MALLDKHFHVPYHPSDEIQETYLAIKVPKQPDCRFSMPPPKLSDKPHLSPSSGCLYFPPHSQNSGQTQDLLLYLQLNPFLVM